jgi:hypothetical protein
MKLASLFVVLVLGGVAHADDRAPVDPYASDDAAADPFAGDDDRDVVDPFDDTILPADMVRWDSPQQQQMPGQRGMRGMRGERGGMRGERGMRGQRGELRRLLIAHFDRNGDGRLEPRERRAAARALRRIAKRLARGGQQQGRAGALIRRFDLNHDGNVGPGEMPPGLADRLRARDRNRDGWLSGDELP